MLFIADGAVVPERSLVKWRHGGLFQIGGVQRVQMNNHGLRV